MSATQAAGYSNHTFTYLKSKQVITDTYLFILLNFFQTISLILLQ